MTKTANSNIDKEHIIKFLWTSLHDMAFLDIKKASDGKSKMGAFILASCFIDYLAGFRFGKESSREDYKNFVKKYLTFYNPEKLYKDLRCKLVHNYSEGGSYSFTDNRADLHMKQTQDKKTVLNLENFIADIEAALHTYFYELKSDQKTFELAYRRLTKISILSIKQVTIFLDN